MQNFAFFLSIFSSWNGIFVKKRALKAELRPLYDHMKSGIYVGVGADKSNINSDYNKIKADFRKSLSEYKYGQTK